MSIKSPYYREMILADAVAAGWFPSNARKFKDDYHRPDNVPTLYYPGAFGQFHEGHIAAIKKGVDSIYSSFFFVPHVVIAPTNSDYTVQKYGADDLRASNHYRVKRIREMMAKHLPHIKYEIDDYCMMNFDADINVTDQIDYLSKSNVFLLSGKDRDEFTKLPLKTVFIKTVNDVHGKPYSTSASEPMPRVKKRLTLRYHGDEQLKVAKLFSKMFGEHYSDVNFHSIGYERSRVMGIVERLEEDSDALRSVATICKDYSDILPYIPVHRTNDGHICDSPEDMATYSCIIDSDTFTGGTMRWVLRNFPNITNFLSIHRFKPETEECIDVADLIGENAWRYPDIDVSFHASLPAFDQRMHMKWELFLELVNKND